MATFLNASPMSAYIDDCGGAECRSVVANEVGRFVDVIKFHDHGTVILSGPFFMWCKVVRGSGVVIENGVDQPLEIGTNVWRHPFDILTFVSNSQLCLVIISTGQNHLE
jgi:hypothetical protein